MTLDDILLIARTTQRGRDGTAREIRQRAGLSLAAVGKVLGVNPSAVQRWEKGETRPRGDMAIKYAELLTQLEAAVRSGRRK